MMMSQLYRSLDMVLFLTTSVSQCCIATYSFIEIYEYRLSQPQIEALKTKVQILSFSFEVQYLRYV